MDSVYTVLFFFFILVSHETVLVVQSCPSLRNTMDYSPPGSSVPGISQGRILGWVAMSFSRGSSWPGDETHVSQFYILVFWFFFFKTDFGFRFTVNLSRRYEVSHSCLLPRYSLPIYQHSALEWYICNSWRIYTETKSPYYTLGFTAAVPSMGFNRCIMPYIPYIYYISYGIVSHPKIPM